MATQGGISVAGLVVMRHHIAGERLKLVQDYHCRVVKDSEWFCVEKLENWLWILGKHIVAEEKRACAEFKISFIEGVTPESVDLYIDGTLVAGSVSMSGSEAAVLAAFVTAINSYFTTNSINGQAFLTGSSVTILAPASYNDFQITWTVTDVDPVSTAEITVINHFDGGAEIGKLYPKCSTDCADLKNVLDTLSSMFVHEANCGATDLVDVTSRPSDCCQELLPVAALDVTVGTSPVDVTVDATASKRCGGIGVNPLDVGGNVILNYQLLDIADPDNPILVVEYEILPGADASNFSNYTYIGGVKTALDLQNNFVPAITGTGINFTIDPSIQGFILSNSNFAFRLIVKDLCGQSEADHDVFIVISIPGFFFQTSGASTNIIINGLGSALFVWGDGSPNSTYPLPMNVNKVWGTQTVPTQVTFTDEASVSLIDLAQESVIFVAFSGTFVNQDDLDIDLFGNLLDGSILQDLFDHLTTVTSSGNVDLNINLVQNSTVALTDAQVAQVKLLRDNGNIMVLIEAFETDNEMDKF